MAGGRRVVLVHRRTELDELLARHGTLGQVRFFLDSRGVALADVERRHAETQAALQRAEAQIPLDWRRLRVERAAIPRAVLEPSDIVVVVGQDGLVANVARYLDAQPVIGIDPTPGQNVGALVPHAVADLGRLLAAVAAGTAALEQRTMVELVSDDGQRLVALNEIYLGQPSHQTARWTLELAGREVTHRERQASSGLVVGTGTGATGWCRSLQRQQAPDLPLPSPTDGTAAWFVREAWPSPSTGTALVAGRLADDTMSVRVESDTLVAFGDGMEDDRVLLGWGQQVRIAVSQRRLYTVGGGRHGRVRP